MKAIKDLERLEQFDRWLASPQGVQLAERECAAVSELAPERYFPVAAQFGVTGSDLLVDVNAGRRVRVTAPGEHVPEGAVFSDFHALPFGHHSIDLAVLPHTLDFVADPHALLRELTEAMAPDGHILIIGFQPYSLWGARKWLWLPRDVVPWCGHFFSTSRIQDWLSLMGYRVRSGKMLVYRPPIFRQGVHEKLAFLERAGDRWWPMFGAVYMIHAQLETMRMIPLRPLFRTARLKQKFTQPAARRLRSTHSSQRP
ncbi:MAG: hypothetical protein DHS20C01_17240 [marine bacterium B5-7]|nr:MAG: hypothetical protein DHS20C01_17240 [marine bacterium B5-7]